MNPMPIMNKAFIDGHIYDVMQQYEFGYYPYYGDSLAVIVGDYILPLRTTRCNKPGIYCNGITYECVFPKTQEEAAIYSKNHLAYFVSANTFKDVIAAKEKLEKDEFNHLVSRDNIFVPVIDMVNDTALMIGLKMAVAKKNCNINNYSDRFGPDFNNDRRKFNGNDITASKYKSISNNMDIRTTLIIDDMNPDVANPMGQKIILTWVGDGENDTEYENFYRNAIARAGHTPVLSRDNIINTVDNKE